MPKFDKVESERLDNDFERWVYAIKYGEKYVYEEVPDNLREDEIVMALNEMRKASESDDIR